MDITLTRPPFVSGGIACTSSNSWVIGTCQRVFVVMPELTFAGEALQRREVTVGIEMEQNIEGFSILTAQPNSPLMGDTLVVLASDSTIRVFIAPDNQNAHEWDEAARHAFGHSDQHVCSVAATVVDWQGSAVPVVAAGMMGGGVSLAVLQAAESGALEVAVKLDFATGRDLVSSMTWVEDRGGDSRILVTCSADGTAALWQVSADLSSATLLCELGSTDMRQFTVCQTASDAIVLCKLGAAFIVDVDNPTAHAVVRLGVSDIVTSCVVDKQRGRIYVGSLDFSIFVLERAGDGWVRSLAEEAQLKNGLKRTVEDSFTTPFVMARLQLRGLFMSPSGRRLIFAADDQTDWSIVSDGQGVTRFHLHQFDDWTDAAAELALKGAAGREDAWAVVWDLLCGLSEEEVLRLVQALLDTPDSREQRLYMLNMIGAKCKSKQVTRLLGGARSDALDVHVRALFSYIQDMLEAGFVLGDGDNEYLKHVSWAVHEPVFSDIVGELPDVLCRTANDAEAQRCPICQSGMQLHSRQVAVCTKKHIFDVCSVTLAVLREPRSEQCGTCKAKRLHASGSAGLVGKMLGEFPACPFCRSKFVSVL